MACIGAIVTAYLLLEEGLEKRNVELVWIVITSNKRRLEAAIAWRGKFELVGCLVSVFLRLHVDLRLIVFSVHCACGEELVFWSVVLQSC